MAVTTTTFDSLLSGLSSETTNSIEIIMRNTSTGVSKKMSFATFAALLYAWITSNKASDLASVLGGSGLTVNANAITDGHARIGTTGIFIDCFTSGATSTNCPTQYGALLTISKAGNGSPAFLAWVNYSDSSPRLHVASSWNGNISAWTQLI